MYLLLVQLHRPGHEFFGGRCMGQAAAGRWLCRGQAGLRLRLLLDRSSWVRLLLLGRYAWRMLLRVLQMR
jgi:hypothetical protein